MVAPGRDTNIILCTLVTNHQSGVKVRKWEIGEAKKERERTWSASVHF